ncbi:MAG: NADH-quinone oxidoreductase subunit NuoG [Desulfobacteraceae bacterium]
MLTIDNQSIEVPAGTKVIEAAERLGIMIPRFCYHPALGSVGACRVCAVAFLEGPVKGIQMSCMVNAQDGMVVSTTDDEVADFRRHVIEWLMVSHPHDCPVCDEGGHCLLQDMTVSGGHGLRRYLGLKRTHRDQNLGPLIQHEMNRCIACYRCARYYQEFAGARDLGVMGIGSRVYFGRHQSGTLQSPFAGNLIDICPTGVYTDKPSRFFGRRWDFQRAPSICLNCSLGCNLVASARYRRMVRHEARVNMDVNGHFICDRGRYGYAYHDSEARPRQAMVKGAVRSVPEALSAAREALGKVIRQHGPLCTAAVGSVRSSLETLAALVHHCRQHQWRGPALVHEGRKAENIRAATGLLTPDLAVSLGAVSVADFVLIIGADPINEAPMLTLSIRQAQRHGGGVAVIDPRPVEMPLDFDHLPVPPDALGGVIQHMIQAACTIGDHGHGEQGPDGSEAAATDFTQRLDAITARFCKSRRAVIVCGTDIVTIREIKLAAELAQTMRDAGTEAKLFYPLNGPNGFAAGMMTETADTIDAMLDHIEAGRTKALVVVENDLWHHFPDRTRLMAALTKLELLILLDHAASPLVKEADIFLPTQTVYEAGGRWINQEGRVQSAQPALSGGASIETVGKGNHPPRTFGDTVPVGSPAAAWQLLTALTAQREEGSDALADAVAPAALEQIRTWADDLQDGKRIDLTKGHGISASPIWEEAAESAASDAEAITVLLVDWTFGTEKLSMSCAALANRTPDPVAVVHPETAASLGLDPGGRVAVATQSGVLTVALQTDVRMARNVMAIPRHVFLDWQVLGGTRLTMDPKQLTRA